jgi:hypothetical protein
MPAKPRWYKDIPAIRVRVAESGLTFLDRDAIERLFKIKRQRAVDLLNELGGYQVGNAFIVQSARVLKFLETLQRGLEWRNERLRRRRVREALLAAAADVDARRVTFKVERAQPRNIADMPDGVSIGPTEIRIRFGSAEDAFKKLFALAQALKADWKTFEKIAGTPPPPAEPADLGTVHDRQVVAFSRGGKELALDRATGLALADRFRRGR